MVRAWKQIGVLAGFIAGALGAPHGAAAQLVPVATVQPGFSTCATVGTPTGVVIIRTAVQNRFPIQAQPMLRVRPAGIFAPETILLTAVPSSPTVARMQLVLGPATGFPSLGGTGASIEACILNPKQSGNPINATVMLESPNPPR